MRNETAINVDEDTFEDGGYEFSWNEPDDDDLDDGEEEPDNYNG